MVACAVFLGRDAKTCTRGKQNCLCRNEEYMDKDELIVLQDRYENLQAQNERLKDLLRQIAYPKRGTEEEYMDIQDASNLIQANFSLGDLEA